MPRKATYRRNLFDHTTLTSLEAVENAVSEFLEIVHPDNVERVLEDVISSELPAVLRLILSRLDQELILTQIPRAAEGFSGSLAYQILAQLSEFFVFAHTVPHLREDHYQVVKEAPGVLAAMAAEIVGYDVRAAPAREKPKGNTQRAAKNERRRGTAATKQETDTLVAGPFERFDLPVPKTRGESEAAKELVLATYQSIMTAYLESLRQPAVSISLKMALVSSGSLLMPPPEEAVVASRSSDAEKESSSVETFSLTFQQPLKFSALYQRRASGFGHWAVTIAPRAEQDLRQYSRRDRKTFLLIVGKMKDLSNGDFSPRNHKQINANDLELVPIYAANVANKLNLVYQIDCGPVHDTKSEEQSLKVFGVYEEANIIRRSFWTSLGYELGKRGDGYKDRCTRRQPATGASDSIFVPVKFPAQPDVQLDFADVPDLPPDDVEEIQCLLLKTVHFSQSLLESIISDLDVAFVLEISPIELDVVEHENSCYVLGRSGTGKTTTMLYKMLLVEVSASDHPEQRKLRQMFVTKSRTLANKVGEHFGKLLGGHRPSAISKNVTAAIKADRALVLDSENDWRSDLPRRFSDLQDADFPLFVSFDELCTMLEVDMEASGFKIAPGRPTLNEKRFKSDYWPGFSQALRKGFDPSMIFSEFLGVISGSEQALHCKSSCLDREAYFNLGERGHSVFTDQRERIYDLFEKYRSQKRRLGDRDAAERTHGILKFLQERRKDSQGDTKPPSAPLTKIDFLYVDEAQDSLLIDCLLLRSLCSNPNGLFWAGDTAQTINVGSSFRFNHLKAFMYRIEQRRREKHPELSFQPVAPPRTFELTVNYRSHAGIVNCAHSIIELITKLWPDAIDVLERERGTVDGPPPIFFTNWDPESSEAQDFLFGNKRSGGYSELGAHQCILVRDDAARERLQREVGEIGIIMTLYESKGLEFNDVLLYNFFEDSAVLAAQWRVVLNALRCPNDAGPTPTFHKILHANVCTELKFLYVAITRARNNIWIADSSSKGEPMRRLWASRNLVRSERLEENTLGFATSSTAVEWEVRARSMFESERFSQAKLCYERAKMPREAAVAQAYHLRALATQVPTGHREVDAKKTAFLSAANAFVTCAENDVGTGGRIYLRRAGECFEHGGDIGKAIKAHSKARHFDRVVELYRTANQFDQAIDIIEGHRQDINPKLAEEVTSKARFFNLEKGQIQKGLRLFDSPEEALEYLQKRGLKTQEASVLELLGKFSAAAELHLQDGRTLKAAELFLQDRAGNRALECLLQAVSLGLVPNDPLVSRILQLAGKVDPSTLSQGTRDELSVIRAIANREVFELQSLGRYFYGNNNASMALLCLDHCFTNAPNSEGLPADGLKQRLEAFRAYKRLLRKFAFEIDPCSSDATEKVFGFRRVAGGTRRYSMRPGTFIPMHSFSNKNVVAGPELRTLFRKALEARLYERVPMEFEPVLVALPPSRPPTPCQPPVSEIKATEDAKDEVLPRDGKDQDKGEYENEVVSGDPEDKRQDEGARKDLDLDDPPLRHLLLCLELVMTRAYDEKRTVQKEIGSAVTEALEQAKERFEELHQFSRQIATERKVLQSADHKGDDLDTLKSKAGKAIALLRKLPFAEPESLQGHLDMVLARLKPQEDVYEDGQGGGQS